MTDYYDQLGFVPNNGSARCSRCRKPLSNPNSVRRGMGPVCSGKVGSDVRTHTADVTDRYLNVPLESGIILRRDENGILTNVPHLVIHHSPTGFEFGYGGSGPADLALNICEAMLRKIGHAGPTIKCWDGRHCFALSQAMHQDFKWQFVATAPRDGITLDYETVKQWTLDRLENPGDWDQFFVDDATDD